MQVTSTLPNYYMKKKHVYKHPKWFRALPQSRGHGNTLAQRKLWKLTSDMVRKEEWEKYGTCVSCHRKIDNWQDGQCGHFKAWSACNGFFKFERKNLALQCGYCNFIDDGVIGTAFGEELKRRYGKKHLEWIEKENIKHTGERLDDVSVVEMAATLLGIT